MEGTLRLFVPIVNVREYGRKCLSGIMLIVLLHMLAVSTERFSVTDEPENSAQVFPVMAGEDVFVDKGNVLKERVLDPFVKTEIKADRIETALLPDSMIVESMKIDGKENTMNGFYDMDADAAVNAAVDTVTVSSENAGVGEMESPTTEETGTPILWEVTCYGNGGFPAAASYSFDADSFAGDELSVPVYEGKIFTGWYEDEACTIPFDRAEGEKRKLTLYAGWKTETYMLSDRGYLIDCGPELVTDGLLLLPSDGSCTGVEAHAFDKLAQMVEEIYIPANITYIAPEAFENLTNLIYIEVAPNNPVYYSVNGELYMKDGDHLVK